MPGGRQPDLVRATRLQRDEREPAWSRRVGDVVEPESLEDGGSGLAGLEARDREVAREACRLHVTDDRLLGPRAGDGRLAGGVREGRDPRGMPRVAQVVDPYPEAGAAIAVPAGQVRVP